MIHHLWPITMVKYHVRSQAPSNSIAWSVALREALPRGSSYKSWIYAKKKGKDPRQTWEFTRKKDGDIYIYMNLLEHAALPCFTHQKFGFKLSSEIERGV